MTTRPSSTTAPVSPTPAARPASVPGLADRARGRVGVRACGHEAAGPHDDAGVDVRGGGEARALCEEILALYRELAGRADLSPGPDTDALFTRLVGLATASRSDAVAAAVLDDPAVGAVLDDLRAVCARGETAMEQHWAGRIAAAADPAAELDGFPYLENYRDLTRLELHAVAGHLPHAPRRMLFVGSGPLPLTALMLAERHGVAVDALDVDPGAVALGARVAGALGVTGVRFAVGDALDGATWDLDGYDAVCLAALVGLEPAAKARVLAHVRVRLAPGALVLVRSAHSLRGLLYPVVAPDDLAGLEPLSVVHPFTDVVNSVVLARVPA